MSGVGKIATMILDGPDHERTLRYMREWFHSKDEAIAAVGCDATLFDALIDAHVAPGVVYSFHIRSGWWSALAAYKGEAIAYPLEDGIDWYSPAAVWQLRRAILTMRMKGGVTEAAHNCERRFVAEFCAYLRKYPAARIAFSDCYGGKGEMLADAAAERAAHEWHAWIAGAYAVCIRNFSARTCIRKETLATLIKIKLEKLDHDNSNLAKLELYDMAEALSQLIMPFAPWERPAGTPGLAIDQTLSVLELGRELPYG